MRTKRTQEEMYDSLYKESQFREPDIPDYKICDNREVENRRILVLGAGTARDIRFLKNHNKIWALDISSRAVSFLNKIGIKAFRADLNSDLQFKSKYFDIVVAKDILEHLDNPSNLAKEIHRVLKPSGYAVINVPNHFYFLMRLRLIFGKNLIWKSPGHDHTQSFKEWNYMHKIFFTWSGFKEFLKVHKLRIIKEFWDFGTLSHYDDPNLVFPYLRQQRTGRNLFARAILTIGVPAWAAFNIIFPRQLRSKIVSFFPGLLCASFYVWCVRSKDEEIRKPTKHG